MHKSERIGISNTLAYARHQFDKLTDPRLSALVGRRRKVQSVAQMKSKVAKAEAKRELRCQRNKRNFALQQENYYFVN